MTSRALAFNDTRAHDAEVKPNDELRLLVLQCRVRLMDPESIIHHAHRVVAAHDSFEQMRKSIEDDEAEWAYHAATGE
jgi:hypothetical protein